VRVGNGCGVKRPGCGAFYRLGEAGRRGVRGERQSVVSGRYSRLWFRSRVPRWW
jgi:hypothetical protein